MPGTGGGYYGGGGGGKRKGLLAPKYVLQLLPGEAVLQVRAALAQGSMCSSSLRGEGHPAAAIRFICVGIAARGQWGMSTRNADGAQTGGSSCRHPTAVQQAHTENAIFGQFAVVMPSAQTWRPKQSCILVHNMLGQAAAAIPTETGTQLLCSLPITRAMRVC